MKTRHVIAGILGICLLLNLAGLQGADFPAERLGFSPEGLALRQISNSFNGRITAYTFGTESGTIVEIRRVSGSSVDVLTAPGYDAAHPQRIRSPYRSVMVRFESVEAMALAQALVGSAARLEKTDPRIPYLLDLSEEIVGKPRTYKLEKIHGFGVVYDEKGRVLEPKEAGK
jgi:hypothetical protein